MKYLNFTLKLLIISFFSYTLFYKIYENDVFIDTLNKSTIIKDNQILYIQYFVPFSELTTILFLLFNKKNIGFYFSFTLLLIFTFYLIALNNFSFYKGCSCGGIFNKLSYSEHLTVNILFIVISLIGILFYKNKSSINTSVIQ